MSDFVVSIANGLKPYGFKKRGTALFRVHGDGVLQYVKIDNTKRTGIEVYIGMQSMYAELMPEWFTSSGCILRYSVVNIIGQRWSHVPCYECDMPALCEYLTSVLFSKGIPWMSSILTQRDLAEGLCYLESSWGGPVLWNDEMKIAPYLACGEMELADKVVSAILEQHRMADKQNRQLFSREAYMENRERDRAEDENFERIQKMIREKDNEEIKEYLHNNYLKNCQYAKFCMK